MNQTLGIILIVLGLFGLVDQTHSVPLGPIAGAAALIGGIVVLVGGRTKPA